MSGSKRRSWSKVFKCRPTKFQRREDLALSSNHNIMSLVLKVQTHDSNCLSSLVDGIGYH